MAESKKKTPSSHESKLEKQLHWIIGAVVVVALLLAWQILAPARQMAHGIMYPLDGQSITGESIELLTSFPLDKSALSQSLRRNGQELEVESIEGGVMSNSAHRYEVFLDLNDGDSLQIDSLAYNQLRNTTVESSPDTELEMEILLGEAENFAYEKLRQDFSWTYSGYSTFIDSVGFTDNSELTQPEFEAKLSGTDDDAEELIVFSVPHAGFENRDDMLEASQGAEELRNTCRYDGTSADLDWTKAQFRPFSIAEQSSQQVTFSAQDWGRDNSCFFVALASDASTLQSFYSNPWQPAGAEITVTELFNPDEDFSSLLAIDFDTPYYDTQKKRTPDEEIDYRHGFKKKLAALIQASPAVPVDPELITLYPDQATVQLPLKANTRYDITLHSGPDVYGESFPARIVEVETGELKYLGLRQEETQSIFMDTAPPSVYVLHAEIPDAPTLKLCRVGIQEYGKIEHIVSRRSEYNFAEQFLSSGIDDLPVRECQEQLVELSEDTLRTDVDLSEMIGAPARSGLYYLTFSFQGERKLGDEFPASSPLFFSIVDTHVSMKISKNGKAFFWANDLQSGDGIGGLTLRAYQNTFTASESKWNSKQSKYDYTYYNPLENNIYGDATVLGTTDEQGFLEVDMSTGDYQDAFPNYYDEEKYHSLLVTAANDDHLSYVVSKWNSGIADWNFGYSPESWGDSSSFSAHLYTDRKLYKPGETVHFKAIIREEGSTLRIPSDRSFRLKITDANFEVILEESIEVNEWGSYIRDIQIDEAAPLGTYRVDLRGVINDGTEFIRGAEFSVEEFKKPTFKVEVAVDSPQLEDEQFFDPQISEESTYWGYRYKNYSKDLTLEADVHASYYAGGFVANGAYRYTVYKQFYYDSSWWGDCYYGCYWEPAKQYYSQGKGSLDNAGKGKISIPITHETSWNDFRYIVEISVSDPSSQEVTGSGSVIVKIPDSLRQSDPNVAVELETSPQFVPEGEDITLILKPERKWQKAHNDRYEVVLVRRHYSTKHSKQVGGSIVPQVDFEDEEVKRVSVTSSAFDQQDDNSLTRDFTLSKDGEYRLEWREKGVDGAEGELIKVLTVYAYDPEGITNTPVVADNKIAVVTEKSSYHLGETANLLIRLPFTDGKALMTVEKKEVVSKEIIDISGNTLVKEIPVDDSFLPNAYISVIAFKPSGDTGLQPEYKVGYAEVVVDKTDKKLYLENKADKETYSPRENVTLALNAKDRNDKPVRAELSVAVVDEALIAMMGNIDMDILPKFFKKIVFQTHTALTNVAMLRQLYFARKGEVGGSGGKEGGDAIFTRTNFKNTAFYAGSVITDANGRANLTFDLPDNIGNFRIITLGHSKDNFFGAAESTIEVRQEIVVEETFPLVARLGDDMRVGATVFNNAAESKTVFVSLDADGLSTPDENRQEVSISAGEREFVTWRVRVQDDIRDLITYTITAAEGDVGGDRIQKTVPVAKTPLISNRVHFQDDFQSGLETNLEVMEDLDTRQTEVHLTFSTTILAGIEKVVTSLLKYPYGCIEQTISSTMPNAVVSKFRDLLDVDLDDATIQKNIDAGIARFQSMQMSDGGFAYWEGGSESEPHITPYAVLSLVQMRDLGAAIPALMISNGQNYIENQVRALSGKIDESRLSQLVHELHALSHLDSGVFGTARTLLKNRLDQLSTHETIVYALALAKKDPANYRSELDELLSGIDLSKAGDSGRNWYWNKTADKALFTQLLLKLAPDDERIITNIRELYNLDLGSYYFSTQAKIQSFIAFTQYIEQVDFGRDKRVTLDYQLGGKSGRVRLNDRDIFKKLTFRFNELREIGEELPFSVTVDGESDQRIYTDLTVLQIPTDPTSIPAQQDKGVTVKRQYFRLGKVKESENWWNQERDLAAVSGNQLKLGETYLVRVEVDFDDEQRQVALESFLPAGLKILNPRMLTEATQVGERRWNWPFYHQEFRFDRAFASANYVSGGKDTFEYYVRAIVPGTFLEPPVSVYPMYSPEIEAHTAFREIVIEE